MKTEQDLIQLASQSIEDLGGPSAMNGENVHAVMFFLTNVARTKRDALHAFAAGMAQAQAKAEGISSHIDVDQCTAYMVALRDPSSQVRRFVPLSSIELIVSAAMQQQAIPATTTTNTPIAAPHDFKTIH